MRFETINLIGEVTFLFIFLLAGVLLVRHHQPRKARRALSALKRGCLVDHVHQRLAARESTHVFQQHCEMPPRDRGDTPATCGVMITLGIFHSG